MSAHHGPHRVPRPRRAGEHGPHLPPGAARHPAFRARRPGARPHAFSAEAIRRSSYVFGAVLTTLGPGLHHLTYNGCAAGTPSKSVSAALVIRSDGDREIRDEQRFLQLITAVTAALDRMWLTSPLLIVRSNGPGQNLLRGWQIQRHGLDPLPHRRLEAQFRARMTPRPHIAASPSIRPL